MVRSTEFFINGNEYLRTYMETEKNPPPSAIFVYISFVYVDGGQCSGI